MIMDIDIFKDKDLMRLLEYLKKMRSVDFCYYRPNTINRRLDYRLRSLGIKGYADYLKYLMETPEELDNLINTLTIKVSAFFRNPFVFEALAETVLPEIMDSHRGQIIRVWSCGCAKGEEAYSIAILIKELYEKDGERPNAFILGTDIDKGAIEEAQKGIYRPDALLETKKRYLDKYFGMEGSLYRVNKDIRSMAAFVYHDITTLTQPKEGIFKEYHLILLRNLLIYFSKQLYERILRYLIGVLPLGSFLVLGEAETIVGDIRENFEEVIPGTKIFMRV